MKTSKNKLIVVLGVVLAIVAVLNPIVATAKGPSGNSGSGSSGGRPPPANNGSGSSVTAPPQGLRNSVDLYNETDRRDGVLHQTDVYINPYGTTKNGNAGTAQKYGNGTDTALGNGTTKNGNVATGQKYGNGNGTALGNIAGSQNTSGNPNGNGTPNGNGAPSGSGTPNGSGTNNTTTVFGGNVNQHQPPKGNYYPGTPYVAERPVYENPAFSGLPIKITDPAASGVTLNYTLQGAVYTIAPGYSQDLVHDRSWVVEFNRGANLGQVRYGLEPGTYAFTYTDHGWDLRRMPDVQSGPIAAPANPPSPAALPANPAPKP